MFARAGYLRRAIASSSFGFKGSSTAPRSCRFFLSRKAYSTAVMATPFKIVLGMEQSAEFRVEDISDQAAEITSRLLQVNHEKWHIFFNEAGFHNHIVHHLLTVFALGASPQTIQNHFDENTGYQRRLAPLNAAIVKELHNDPEAFNKYLGKQERYHEFLQFFKEEMESKGWENVLNEYVFSGGERGDDLLVRLYAGFLHPIIHLGFGIEFGQPAIIAEALAQTCVHENWMSGLFYPAEAEASKHPVESSIDKTLVELLNDIRADSKLRTSPKWSDGNKVRDGVLARAGPEMIKYAAQYRVDASTLEKKTAEMINAAVYFTGAAQRPPHVVKFDFYYMHCVNSSIWFSTFLKQDWLDTASKCRLLEWKGRADLALYASRRAPELLGDEIRKYAGEVRGWEDVIAHAREIPDDGHTSKFVRAIAHGESVCGPFEGEEGFVVQGDMWLKLANMVVASVDEKLGDQWVRSCGFDEAWKDFPLRDGGKL